MKQEVKIAQTDYTVLILVRDTAGAAKTGLTNASAGLDVSYIRVETDNDVVVTAGAPVALATPALTDPHLDWGFLEVDATNHPGIYRLDIADGVFATGAWSAVVTLIGTGLDPTSIEFILIPQDPYTGVYVAGQANIDFGATQKASITAAVPTAAAIGTDAASKVLVTPAQKIVTDVSGFVSVPTTQKVDVETIKTQAVTCGAGVTIRADIGAAAAPGSANGMLIGGSNAATTFATLSVTGQMDAGNILVDTTTALTGAVTAPAGITANITGNIIGTLATVTNLTNLPAAGALEATLTAMKGATFSGATDSLEAIRDRGDAAWITATGFSTLDAAGIRTAIGLGAANLDTQLAAIDDYIDTEIGTIITAVGTTLNNHLLDIKGTGFVKDTHSLPQCLTATGFSTHSAANVKTAIEAAGSHLALILEDTAQIGAAGAGLTEAGGTGDQLTALATQASVNTIDGIVDAILLDTAEIGAAGAGLTEAGGTGDHLTAINLPNQTMDIIGNITGNLSGSVGSVTGNVDGTVAGVTPSSHSAADVKTAIEAAGSHLGLIKAVTDALTADAAAKLAISAGTIVSGAAIVGTLSTTKMTTDLTEATDDHYNGRLIFWTSGVLQNQATDITDYDGASKLLTYTAVTEAPTAADTFIIV